MSDYQRIEAALKRVGLPAPVTGDEWTSWLPTLADGIEKLVAVAEAARDLCAAFGAGSEMSVSQSYFLQMACDSLAALEVAEP